MAFGVGIEAWFLHLSAVDVPHRIFGVTGVLEGDEGEPWWLSGDPDRSDAAELAEDIVNVALLHAVVEVSEVYLGRKHQPTR